MNQPSGKPKLVIAYYGKDGETASKRAADMCTLLQQEMDITLLSMESSDPLRKLAGADSFLLLGNPNTTQGEIFERMVTTLERVDGTMNPPKHVYVTDVPEGDYYIPKGMRGKTTVITGNRAPEDIASEIQTHIMMGGLDTGHVLEGRHIHPSGHTHHMHAGVHRQHGHPEELNTVVIVVTRTLETAAQKRELKEKFAAKGMNVLFARDVRGVGRKANEHYDFSSLDQDGDMTLAKHNPDLVVIPMEGGTSTSVAAVRDHLSTLERLHAQRVNIKKDPYILITGIANKKLQKPGGGESYFQQEELSRVPNLKLGHGSIEGGRVDDLVEECAALMAPLHKKRDTHPEHHPERHIKPGKGGLGGAVGDGKFTGEKFSGGGTVVKGGIT